MAEGAAPRSGHAAQQGGKDGGSAAEGGVAALAAGACAGAGPGGGSEENAAAAGNGGGGSACTAGGGFGDPAKGGAGGGQEQPGRLGQPLAFLHYRFEEEEGEAVLYCYEIQVAQAAQVGCPLALPPGVRQGPAGTCLPKHLDSTLQSRVAGPMALP